MKPSSSRFATSLAVVVGIALVACLGRVFADAKLVAKESSQRALFTEAVESLSMYHEKHGQYPNSLSDLDLKYPDGGDRSLLLGFSYKSSGKSYSLTMTGVSTGQKLKESR